MSLLAAPLPGLYLTLLGFLLARALRRWWDPLPPRVWLVFGSILLILFGPALFLGKVLAPVDILPGLRPPEEREKPPAGNVLQLDLATQTIPWQAQVRRAVRAGHWPLWNDLAGAGMPLLADPQSQVLQPLVLLTLPLPLPQAIGVTAALRVLIALVFLFLLLRRQGLAEEAALFGSLAFGLGGFLLLWLGWPIGNSPALLPLVLYALVMTDERGAPRDFLLLTLAAASLLAGGHPETILYVAGVGGVFALSRLLRRGRVARARLLARWAIAGGIAFGLAAPTALPALRFLPQTHRGRLIELRNERMARGSPLQGSRSSDDWRQAFGGIGKRLVPVFAPNAFGNSRWGAYWGETNTNEDATGFVGGAALLAALLALFPVAHRLPQERLFLILGAVSLAAAVRIPGVPWMLTKLPVLNQSASVHHRLLLVVAFCLAYVGACSVDRWRRGEGPGRGAIAVCAAVLLGLVAWVYLLSPEMKTLLPLRWFWMALQLATVAVVGIILLFFKAPSSPGEGGREGTGEEGRGGEGLGGNAGRISRPGWILISLLAVELLVFHRPANPSLPRKGFYPTTPAVAFLQQHADGFRIAGLGDRLLPNAAAVYGLADIRISNPFKPAAYVRAVAPISVSARATEHQLIKQEHPLLQLLGVRYVIAPPKLRPARGWRPVFRDGEARIFERTTALPRLFLPGSAEASTVATLDLLSLEPARIAARARLAGERILASSVYQDGGWSLLLDGRPAPTLLANGPFLASRLPAGDHRVDLLYRAPGLAAGLALAALAITGLVLSAFPTPGTRDSGNTADSFVA